MSQRKSLPGRATRAPTKVCNGRLRRKPAKTLPSLADRSLGSRAGLRAARPCAEVRGRAPGEGFTVSIHFAVIVIDCHHGVSRVRRRVRRSRPELPGDRRRLRPRDARGLPPAPAVDDVPPSAHRAGVVVPSRRGRRARAPARRPAARAVRAGADAGVVARPEAAAGRGGAAPPRRLLRLIISADYVLTMSLDNL